MINILDLPVRRIPYTIDGGYDSINNAYKALFEYANVHSIKLLTPSREIYMKGPGMIFKGNPENYITKIVLPFEIF